MSLSIRLLILAGIAVGLGGQGLARSQQVETAVDVYIGGGRDNKGRFGSVRDYATRQAGTPGRKVLYFGHGQKKEAIRAIRSLNGERSINIIAHSWGTHTALKVAAEAGVTIDHLVAVDPVGKPDAFGRGRPGNVVRLVVVRAIPEERSGADRVESLGKAIGGVPDAFQQQTDTIIEVRANHEDFEELMLTRASDGRSARDIIHNDTTSPDLEP